jgi:hypothetical protein
VGLVSGPSYPLLQKEPEWLNHDDISFAQHAPSACGERALPGPSSRFARYLRYLAARQAQPPESGASSDERPSPRTHSRPHCWLEPRDSHVRHRQGSIVIQGYFDIPGEFLRPVEFDSAPEQGAKITLTGGPNGRSEHVVVNVEHRLRYSEHASQYRAEEIVVYLSAAGSWVDRDNLP